MLCFWKFLWVKPPETWVSTFKIQGSTGFVPYQLYLEFWGPLLVTILGAHLVKILLFSQKSDMWHVTCWKVLGSQRYHLMVDKFFWCSGEIFSHKRGHRWVISPGTWLVYSLGNDFNCAMWKPQPTFITLEHGKPCVLEEIADDLLKETMAAWHHQSAGWRRQHLWQQVLRWNSLRWVRHPSQQVSDLDSFSKL